ncbi:MAG: hypothetical protein J6X95_04595 [Treponema sp.]|nr:hypothetical protein [Treponema sp.]
MMFAGDGGFADKSEVYEKHKADFTASSCRKPKACIFVRGLFSFANFDFSLGNEPPACNIQRHCRVLSIFLRLLNDKGQRQARPPLKLDMPWLIDVLFAAGHCDVNHRKKAVDSFARLFYDSYVCLDSLAL